MSEQLRRGRWPKEGKMRQVRTADGWKNVRVYPENPIMRAKQHHLLSQILAETKKPSGLRAFFIGLLFPEFDRILTLLSDLSRTVESD